MQYHAKVLLRIQKLRDALLVCASFGDPHCGLRIVILVWDCMVINASGYRFGVTTTPLGYCICMSSEISATGGTDELTSTSTGVNPFSGSCWAFLYLLNQD